MSNLIKQRRYQTRTATVNLDTLISQAKSHSEMSNTNQSYDNLGESNLRASNLKRQDDDLRINQLKYNNEINTLSQQIEALHLGFDDGSLDNQTMTQTAKSTFYKILQKKEDLNLFDQDMDIRINVATDGLNSSKRGTQSSNIKIKQEPPIISQIQKNIAKVSSQILALSNQANLLESKIMNKIRLRDSATQTEFQILRLILTKERVERLEKILQILKVCDNSLQDGVKLSHRLGVDSNMDPTMCQYSDFVNSEFNTGRLKGKYVFNNLFKMIVQQNFINGNGGFENMTLSQAKSILYQDKVRAYLARIKSDLEFNNKY